MEKMIDFDTLNHIVNRMVDNKSIFSAVMKVENSEGDISLKSSAGDLQVDGRYFIASVTKLYVTAVLMMLIEKGKIDINDKISKYLPYDYCDSLHVFKGVDYSKKLTIYHLISNTSGIPDYFFHKQANGRTAADELMDGNDEPWAIDKTIELIKNLKPKFKPGAKRRASYSDTNYQLLGKIIEYVTGKRIGEVFQDYIFSELNLKNTYTYENPEDDSPAAFYYGARKLWLPRYISSITPEGGIVSTVDEVMIFLKEFFKGRFFDKEKMALCSFEWVKIK